MTINYGEVIHRFYAGRQYGVRGPNYEDISWFDTDVAMPTREELEEKWETIKDAVALEEVARARSMPGEYPAREDMIVALWEKVVEGRSEKADALQARRLEIKEKYPKP